MSLLASIFLKYVLLYEIRRLVMKSLVQLMLYQDTSTVFSTVLSSVKRRAFLLWSLLTQAGLSFHDVIVVQKSYSGDWLSLLLKKQTEKIFFLVLTFIFVSNTLCLRLLHIIASIQFPNDVFLFHLLCNMQLKFISSQLTCFKKL